MSNDTTLKEAVEKKRELERQIGLLVYQFEKETESVKVSRINITRYSVDGPKTYGAFAIEVETKL